MKTSSPLDAQEILCLACKTILTLYQRYCLPVNANTGGRTGPWGLLGELATADEGPVAPCLSATRLISAAATGGTSNK